MSRCLAVTSFLSLPGLDALPVEFLDHWVARAHSQADEESRSSKK